MEWLLTDEEITACWDKIDERRDDDFKLADHHVINGYDRGIIWAQARKLVKWVGDNPKTRRTPDFLMVDRYEWEALRKAVGIKDVDA